MNFKKLKKLRELTKKYQYDLATVEDQIDSDEEKLEVLMAHNFIAEMTDKINEMFEIYEGSHDINRFSLFVLQNIAVISADIALKGKKDLKLLEVFSKMFLDCVNQTATEMEDNE